MISGIENTLENRAQTTWKPEDDKMQDQRKGSSGFQNESISHPEAQGYCIRHFITEHHFRLVQVDCGAALKKKIPFCQFYTDFKYTNNLHYMVVSVWLWVSVK